MVSGEWGSGARRSPHCSRITAHQSPLRNANRQRALRAAPRRVGGCSRGVHSRCAARAGPFLPRDTATGAGLAVAGRVCTRQAHAGRRDVAQARCSPRGRDKRACAGAGSERRAADSLLCAPPFRAAIGFTGRGDSNPGMQTPTVVCQQDSNLLPVKYEFTALPDEL